MMSDEAARSVDEVVRAVPGVVRLYAPTGFVRGARALLDAEHAAMSEVHEVDGAQSVRVTVGLASDADPVIVSAAIVTAVRTLLGDAAEVAVRIGRAIG